MNILYRDIGISRKILTRDGTFFSCYIMAVRYFLMNITRSIKRINYYEGLSLMSKSTDVNEISTVHYRSFNENDIIDDQRSIFLKNFLL